MEKIDNDNNQDYKLDYFFTEIIKDQNLKEKINIVSKKFNQKSMNSSSSFINDSFPRMSSVQKKKYNEYKKMEFIDNQNSIEKILKITIPEIAKDIADLENYKQDFISKLSIVKKLNIPIFNFFSENEIYEPFLIYHIKDIKIKNFNICAIDGSFIHESFLNLDLSLFRVIGVIYLFDDVGKIQISYFPDEKGIDNYKLSKFLKNFSDEKVNTHISLERALMEIKLANQIIEESKIDLNMIILDGSILTEPLNLIFSQDNDLIEIYFQVLNEYKKLYSFCDEKQIYLVGVVKDSRSSTFRKIFTRRLPKIIKLNSELNSIYSINYRTLLNYFSDIDFFNRILDEGERSCIFSLNSVGSSWLPRQLDLLKNELENNNLIINNFEFLCFYIKPVPYDFPLRVEFCVNNKYINNNVYLNNYIDKISSIINNISKVAIDFSLPIPQIEAHLRCKLDNSDKRLILNALKQKISYELAQYLNIKINNKSIPKCDFKIDPLMIKFDMLISKRRNRFPI